MDFLAMAKRGISMPCTLRSIPKDIVCIYKIQSPSGKVYIGSTLDLRGRIKHYISFDCKAQRKLFFSFKKYGLISHTLTIIHVCDKNELFFKEREYGILYNVLSNNGLNLALPGDGKNNGLLSEETIAKMKVSQTKEKNNFFGRKHTAESLEKMRQSHKLKSPETIQKMREAQLGKKMSEQGKLNMSLAQKGRTHSFETKLKMRRSSNNLKFVLCQQTGIYYEGAKDAAFAYNMSKSSLRKKLTGNRVNNTSLVYV